MATSEFQNNPTGDTLQNLRNPALDDRPIEIPLSDRARWQTRSLAIQAEFRRITGDLPLTAAEVAEADAMAAEEWSARPPTVGAPAVETPPPVSPVATATPPPDGDALDAILGPTFVPSGHEPPLPPRPGSMPTHGLTRSGHVVELPRTAGQSKGDPLRLVTGAGWPGWYEVTAADNGHARDPEGQR